MNHVRAKASKVLDATRAGLLLMLLATPWAAAPAHGAAPANAGCGQQAQPAPPMQRRVPGEQEDVATTPRPGSALDVCVPAPDLADFDPAIPVPDRWRIVESLGYEQRWWDPYHRNVLKGDFPVHEDWFFSVTAVSDTLYEIREVPTPVGVQTTRFPGQLDVLGSDEQNLFSQTLAVELVYLKGDTVFRPPDYEFRFTPVFNYNRTEVDEFRALNVRPNRGTVRHDHFVGIQTAFVDVHLRNVSANYDFDSLRVGIQPFTAGFRGFLFLDQPFGIRLFGTRHDNVFQYNIAWFRRLAKDTNSGLNDVGEGLREDDIFVANLYWQDAIALGHTLEFVLLYNRNREDALYYDENGFIQRPASFGREQPRTYDVVYLGFNTDGHFDRLNLTTSLYYAVGEQDHAPFTGKQTDIRALFAAAELSFDQDWMRWRLSLLYGSGDDDPYDDVENGFDAVVENPLFAGAGTSYWIRQAVPLIQGGRVLLSTRNGVLNSLRSSRPHGQSNFTNPGIILVGLGADFDILPELQVSANINQLWFDETAVLEAARQIGGLDRSIGTDASIALTYRPLMTQNIILEASYAQLFPGEGLERLFGDDSMRSVVFNVVFTY